MGMHFPPVRAPGYPYAGVLSLRKPVNNTASQQAADWTFTDYLIKNYPPAGPVTGQLILKENKSLINNVNIMNPSFLYIADEDLKDQSDKQALDTNEPPLNEGSEFLDDNIRMKDLPLMFSEEKIDAWGRWGLL